MGIPMGIPLGIPVGMGWVWGLKCHPHGSPASGSLHGAQGLNPPPQMLAKPNPTLPPLRQNRFELTD